MKIKFERDKKIGGENLRNQSENIASKMQIKAYWNSKIYHSFSKPENRQIMASTIIFRMLLFPAMKSKKTGTTFQDSSFFNRQMP